MPEHELDVELLDLTADRPGGTHDAADRCWRSTVDALGIEPVVMMVTSGISAGASPSVERAGAEWGGEQPSGRGVQAAPSGLRLA